MMCTIYLRRKKNWRNCKMAMATPCCYGNFDRQKISFHTVWEGMNRFSGLCDASLFFTFKLGSYRHHAKPGQATLNQIELRSVATCRMKDLRSVSRNFRDGLVMAYLGQQTFFRVILASEVWMVSILNYLDKIFQDQLGLFLLDRLKPAQNT